MVTEVGEAASDFYEITFPTPNGSQITAMRSARAGIRARQKQIRFLELVV